MVKPKQTQIRLILIILSIVMSFGMAVNSQSQIHVIQESIKAIETSSDKAIELRKLSAEMIQAKDFKRIPRLYELLGEVENMAYYWNTQTITADPQNESARSVLNAYGHVTEMTASMRLDIGDVHKEAGQFDKAKKTGKTGRICFGRFERVREEVEAVKKDD